MNTIIVNQVIEPYTQLLDEFFHETTFIGRVIRINVIGDWINELSLPTISEDDKESNLYGRLTLISSFLSESIVPLVLEDVHQMLKHYIET